jgi:flagellar FliJ protein
MRFQYPLQKIVDLKGSEKSMAEWEYAASLGKLRDEEDRLRSLFEERRQIEEQLSDRVSAPVSLAELASLQHYLDVLESRIRLQLKGVEAAETYVRSRQSTLAEKSVDEKVWLNARDKAHQQHVKEMLSKQQNELDEIATVRAVISRG